MDKKLLNKIVLFSCVLILFLILVLVHLFPDFMKCNIWNILYLSLSFVYFLFLILLIHHSIKGQTPKSNRFCFRFILISVCFLMLIFWLPSFDLKESPKKFSNSLLSSNTNIAGNLLKIEVEKVIKEIAANQNSINTWFHFKFLIVAGLFSGFFLYLKHSQEKEEDLEALASRPNLCLLLALAFILCVTMDIQIKSKTIGSKQCGLWLAHYVEEAFIEKHYNNFKYEKEKKFLGWENYLRIGPQGKKENQGTGMHLDFVYSIFYWLPLHSLTYLIYIFFLIVYQNCVTCDKGKGIKDPILFFSIVLVNWMILSIAIQGHAIPSAYEYNIWGEKFDRDRMLFIFFSIGFVLVLLNIMGTLLLIKLKKHDKALLLRERQRLHSLLIKLKKRRKGGS